MKARFTSLKKILDLFSNNEALSPKDVVELSGLQKTVVFKYLKQLVEEGKLIKKGKVPKVTYSLKNRLKVPQEKKMNLSYIVGFYSYQEKIVMDNIFFKFSPLGKIMKGMSGIIDWCEQRNLDIHKKIQDYINIYEYLLTQQDICGMISADEAFGKDFEIKYLDTVLYADQYKYMDFGRGKLAELTFYAKISQNKNLIAESIAEIFPKLECIIGRGKFDAIAITPWSIKRQNQLLGALKKELEVFKIPFVNIIKYSESGIFIPQKSLKSRSERIENAKNTIFVDDKNIGKYKKVLLIDDFVGSGATLNETAKKLKAVGVEEVIGFAFVGNTNLSYEVVNEI